MSFRRTLSGLSNEHLFHQADVVVHVEGGDGLISKYEAGETTEAIDIPFWRAVFRSFAPNVRAHFKAGGSKTALLPIAETVRNSTSFSVVVCMDRDFEDEVVQFSHCPNVMFTWGYSWENDVCSPLTLCRVVGNVCLANFDSDEVDREIDSCFRRFVNDVKWLVKADKIAHAHRVPLFGKGRPVERLVYGDVSTAAPCLLRTELQEAIKRVRKDHLGGAKLPKSHVPHAISNPLREARGHVVELFTYRLLQYILGKYSKKTRISRDEFKKALIRELNHQCRHYDEISRHYKAQLRPFAKKSWSGNRRLVGNLTD